MIVISFGPAFSDKKKLNCFVINQIIICYCRLNYECMYVGIHCCCISMYKGKVLDVKVY